MPKVFIYPTGVGVASTLPGIPAATGIDFFTEPEVPIRKRRRSQPSVTLGMAPPARVDSDSVKVIIDLVNSGLR